MSGLNYSFYAVPAAYILSLLPHMYAISLIERSGSGVHFDNTNPRNNVAKIKDKLPKATLEKIQRAEAAQQNGFENLGLFAASIIAGNIAHLPADSLNLHAGAYLATRALYNLLYISITGKNASMLRSVAYFTGVGFVFSLFVNSGIQVNGGKFW